jgi:pimeloyl-ACP methyl ester carboxylesterase
MRMMSLLMTSLIVVPVAGCKSEKQEASSTKVVEQNENPTSEKPTMPNANAKQKVAPEADESHVTTHVTTHVTSNDGTSIAFEKTGHGPAVIIVSGALSHRAMLKGNPLPAMLGKHFTVYTYDRRGRGGSTNVLPYAVDREIEDLEALVDHAGHAASLYGVSSGAALALQTAAKLGPDKVTALALYEPPYGQPAAEFTEQKQRTNELIKTGKPGDAAAYFMSAIGMPPQALEEMKASPQWAAMEKIDFTLAYDYAILGDGAIPAATARAVTVPALVMNGEKSMPFLAPTADQLATLLPHAQRKTFTGQTHQVEADAMAPVLIEFFTSAAAGK